MSLASRAAGVLGAALLMIAAGQAQDARPLPDRQAFYVATRDNLSRAQREQYRYAYKERRSEVHVNPFGSKVGTDGTRVYEVTPMSADVSYRKLIERNGKPVLNSEPERDESEPPRGTSTRNPIDDIVDALDLTVDRRELLDGRTTVVVTFTPRPDARPQTREGKIAKNFKGSVWVDEQAHEVVRARAVAVDDLTFGFGLFARLNEGMTATVTRQPVEGGIWLPASIRFKGDGRAMLFRKLTIDYVIDWFDYRRVL